MNSQARPRDSTDGRGAKSASIVWADCGAPYFGFMGVAGGALAFISFSNALTSIPRLFIRSTSCFCSAGGRLLNRSIRRAGTNPPPPPPNPSRSRDPAWPCSPPSPLLDCDSRPAPDEFSRPRNWTCGPPDRGEGAGSNRPVLGGVAPAPGTAPGGEGTGPG